jgi:hypothetical protein
MHPHETRYVAFEIRHTRVSLVSINMFGQRLVAARCSRCVRLGYDTTLLPLYPQLFTQRHVRINRAVLRLKAGIAESLLYQHWGS